MMQPKIHSETESYAMENLVWDRVVETLRDIAADTDHGPVSLLNLVMYSSAGAMADVDRTIAVQFLRALADCEEGGDGASVERLEKIWSDFLRAYDLYINKPEGRARAVGRDAGQAGGCAMNGAQSEGRAYFDADRQPLSVQLALALEQHTASYPDGDWQAANKRIGQVRHRISCRDWSTFRTSNDFALWKAVLFEAREPS